MTKAKWEGRGNRTNRKGDLEPLGRDTQRVFVPVKATAAENRVAALVRFALRTRDFDVEVRVDPEGGYLLRAGVTTYSKSKPPTMHWEAGVHYDDYEAAKSAAIITARVAGSLKQLEGMGF